LGMVVAPAMAKSWLEALLIDVMSSRTARILK